MPEYRRAFQPGGCFFITLVTENRAPLFADPEARKVLHSAIQKTRETHPFALDAVVLLHDHLHVIITLPSDDPDFSLRMASIKASFTRDYLAGGGQEQHRSWSRKKHRHRGVWQRRFWEHCILDERDLHRHLDYIHYNPVKHGLVVCPHMYSASSFHRYVRDGFYDADWQCTCRGTPIGLDFSWTTKLQME